MLREAGKRDPAGQTAFLEAHAATMPRVMLRYTIEKLDKPTRDRWLAAKDARA
jgi:3-methyladenine DNA glycosylase AlkD